MQSIVQHEATHFDENTRLIIQRIAECSFINNSYKFAHATLNINRLSIMQLLGIILALFVLFSKQIDALANIFASSCLRTLSKLFNSKGP